MLAYKLCPQAVLWNPSRYPNLTYKETLHHYNIRINRTKKFSGKSKSQFPENTLIIAFIIIIIETSWYNVLLKSREYHNVNCGLKVC